MNIGVASDHAGFVLKERIAACLADWGHEVSNLGCADERSVDYPDYADALCLELQKGAIARGILVCGTGLGMSIAANRYPYIRAALCHDAMGARLSREHNDANVLCLGGRILGVELALEIVSVWLATPFSAGPNHVRRISKLSRRPSGA